MDNHSILRHVSVLKYISSPVWNSTRLNKICNRLYGIPLMSGVWWLGCFSFLVLLLFGFRSLPLLMTLHLYQDNHLLHKPENHDVFYTYVSIPCLHVCSLRVWIKVFHGVDGRKMTLFMWWLCLLRSVVYRYSEVTTREPRCRWLNR